jgi:2-dehydro-3-deoxyphosphogluconate aldolase/(4S)-4-hydroxy-2-oxoglutarate aldolase
MAQFDRLTVLNAMVDTGLIPVFYHRDVQTTISIAEACVAGGVRAVEFTNRGDLAHRVFAATVEHFQRSASEVILGAGSVVDAPTAALYIANGANFVVGPLLNADVARLCNRRKVAYSPGCASMSEIAHAEELGVEIVKLFPGAEVGGPAFVKAAQGPCPWTRIMPTGGVDATRESMEAWFRAGVSCVGVGSKLITKEIVEAGDYAALTEKVKQLLEWIGEIRVEMQPS